MNNTGQWCSIALVALVLGGCGAEQDVSDTPQKPETVATQTSEPVNVATTAQSSTPAAPATPAPREPSPEFANLPEPYINADFARAKRVWRQCSSCHTLAPDAGHLVGPNLYGLFERKVGAAADFNYSTALQEADFDWTPEQLDEWLTSPRKFLPGNRMSFSGVRKPGDRANVIAFILSASDRAE